MFINDDFILSSESARILYHDYSVDLPIIDYHCHLLPKKNADDVRWMNTVICHDSLINGNVWLTRSVPPHSKVYNRQPDPLIKSKVEN